MADGAGAAQSLEETHRVVRTAVMERQPIAASMTVFSGFCVRMYLATTIRESIECSVISTEERVGAERSQTLQAGSGAVSHWRSQERGNVG